MSEAEVKSTVDMVAETRNQMTDYLCVCGVKDVGIIVGALATGMLAGYVGHQVLRGRWRSLPVVVGLALTGAAYFSKRRFVFKSGLVLGGTALLLSNVHFTFADQFEEDRILEA